MNYVELYLAIYYADKSAWAVKYLPSLMISFEIFLKLPLYVIPQKLSLPSVNLFPKTR